MYPDHHGQPRIFWTVQNVHVGVPVPQGSPRMFTDKQGQLRTYAAANTVHTLDHAGVIRVDRAPILDWVSMQMENHSLTSVYT